MSWFKTLKDSFSDLIVHIQHFGCDVAFSSFFSRLFEHGGGNIKHQAILRYLEKNYSSLIDEYKRKDFELSSLAPDCPIYVCWFQGEDHMPSLVKGCLNSIRKNCGAHKVYLVTMENFNRWVSIPNYIIDKVNKKEITLTHFSDLIRNNLLADKGGIWLDATIYLTGELKDFELPFYTIKQNRINDSHYVSGYRWTGFCMGGIKGNPINSFLKDFFNEYHKREGLLIDYLLLDYAIALAYNKIPVVKKLIDDVPYSSPNLYYLKNNLLRPVDTRQLSQVLNDTSIFKLSYKVGVPEDKRALYYYLGLGEN